MATPRGDSMDTIHRAGLALAAILDRATQERRSPGLASHTIDAARNSNDLVLSVAELREVADALDQIGGASEHSATP